MMTKTDLETAARTLIGNADVSTQSLDSLARFMTIVAFIGDTCLNELERRGAPEFTDGHPVRPYESDHYVDTVLTRDHAFASRS